MTRGDDITAPRIFWRGAGEKKKKRYFEATAKGICADLNSKLVHVFGSGGKEEGDGIEQCETRASEVSMRGLVNGKYRR